MIEYIQTFRSLQGEGLFTGCPSVWLRLARCNLTCRGFGQDNPADPSTYVNEFQLIDMTDITEYADLPVFSKGCDSSYAHEKKFRKFIKTKSTEDLAAILDGYVPNGEWDTEDYTFDMVFTGGEPLLKKNQEYIAKLLMFWMGRDEGPVNITFETNGTQILLPELRDLLESYVLHFGACIHFSISPKLFSVSGEVAKRAIVYDAVQSYREGPHGVLPFIQSYKFVLSPSDRAFEEMEEAIDELGIRRRDVWVMPVGGTVEGLAKTAASVADRATSLGYCVSSRVHVDLYGNDPDK